MFAAIYLIMFAIVMGLLLANYDLTKYWKFRKANFLDQNAEVRRMQQRLEAMGQGDVRVSRQLPWLVFTAAAVVFFSYVGIYYTAYWMAMGMGVVFARFINETVTIQIARFNEIAVTGINGQPA